MTKILYQEFYCINKITNKPTNSTSQQTQPIMSRFYNKKSTTPFCSFCRDAGKPRNVYTSHYPKDRPGKDGKVVCPTILSTTCGYCRESGHTTRYCSVLKQRNQDSSQYRKERYRKPRMISTNNNNNNNDGWRSIPTKKHSNSPSYSRKASPVQKPKAKHNKFAALSYDEEIATSPTTTQEDFPSLSINQGPKVTKSKPVLKGAWGKGISSAVKEEKVFDAQPVVEKKDEFSSMASLGMDLNAIVNDAKAYRESLTIKSPISTEWADIEDSDDSDYDSEESYYSDGY